MNWIVRTLVGAVVAGVGWKLGADSYEAIKKQIKKRMDAEAEEEGDEDNGAGATQTHSVEVGDEQSEG